MKPSNERTSTLLKARLQQMIQRTIMGSYGAFDLILLTTALVWLLVRIVHILNQEILRSFEDCSWQSGLVG